MINIVTFPFSHLQLWLVLWIYNGSISLVKPISIIWTFQLPKVGEQVRMSQSTYQSVSRLKSCSTQEDRWTVVGKHLIDWGLPSSSRGQLYNRLNSPSHCQEWPLASGSTPIKPWLWIGNCHSPVFFHARQSHVPAPVSSGYVCGVCGCVCRSRIGLESHNRKWSLHTRWVMDRVQRLPTNF